MIVKIYAEQWRWKQAKEAHVYRLLRQHGVGPVPELLHADDASEHLHGRACTVMTLIEGQPLSAVSASLDATELHRVYRQMGEILAGLHGIDQDAFGCLTTKILDPKPSNTAYMSGQFGKKLREFARDEQRGWRVTGFIDVENAIAADPLIDLAKTDSYSVRGNPAKLAGLLDGYGPRGDAFAERLALYRLYHALELWDWFASLGQSAPLDGLAQDMRHLAGSGANQNHSE